LAVVSSSTPVIPIWFEYYKESAAYYLKDFKKGISDSVNTPPIITGFKHLDELLEGGLYEGLYVLGAISSLGKTTFVLQMADQIAQLGEDVLIFSLEMARSELMSKSISRLTFLNTDDKKIAKTNRGITTGKRYTNYSEKEIDLINNCISIYEDYSKNIYIKEGSGDIGINQIKEAITKHIKYTGKKPIVIIDYLQILAPYDIKATDKQNIDKSVMELKIISRDYKIPVIAISSFNRENYKATVSMAAFKESGAIEYSSDVLLALQFQGQENRINFDEASKNNPRKVELKILKNRNGGKGEIPFDYHQLFNYFEETVECKSPKIENIR
jgi:replicative DNA helicase